MRQGEATPEEEVELLPLLYVLGVDEWPDPAVKGRALNFIRLEAERRTREYRNGYEWGRRKGAELAKKRAKADR